MEGKPHDQIMFMLGQMDGKLDGINTRLDTVNGRVGKHDESIISLRAYKDEANGKIKIIGIIWGVTAAVITSAVSYFFFSNK